MKTNIIAIAALAASITLAAAAEKIKAPNGGRVIDTVDPHAEFLVTAGKKVEIRFMDDAGKVVAPAAQVVTVTMGDRANPTKLTFAREGDKLVSDKTIPEGNELPVVVQFKMTPETRTTNAKFTLNLNKCPTCEHAEYACTCAHGDSGHDHKEGDGHKH